MLFRRVLKHVNDQNWTAVFIDLVIVVIGVFMGIQVANWNEARLLRDTEAGHLRALENDIALSTESLESMLVELNKQQSARQRLYEINRDPDAAASPKEIDDLLQGALFNIQRIRVNQAGFDGLKGAGGYSVIGEPELIAELQALDALLTSAVSRQEEDFQITFLYTDPFLIEEANVDNLLMSGYVGQPGHMPWIERVEGAGVSNDVLRSRKLKNLVLYRAEIADGRIRSTQGLLEQYEKVQALIDVRQQTLGVPSK
ncbi:MAG: hypothetical protein AAF351_02395 [Pseudomonadota bacterium]